jgi:hypothetical protein
MPAAPVLSNWMHGWVNTSSIASTGTPSAVGRLRVLIEVRM